MAVSRSNLDQFSLTVEASAVDHGKPREASQLVLEPGLLKVRVHSQRPDEVAPISPINLPVFGSPHHSSSEEGFIRSTEITLVKPSVDGQKIAQDDWFGSKIFW